MGTNYYVRTPCPNPCEHCAGYVETHLGKSSMGWTFSFRGDPEWTYEENPNALQKWVERASSGVIADEYGVEHTFEEMMAFILRKTNASQSHAALYPRDDGSYMVDGHSFTTYDFC